MARTLRTRASSSVKRPMRSYNNPSRIAPSATRTRSMPRFSTISNMMARPLKSFFRNSPIIKINRTQADAAHRQTLEQQRRKTLPDHDLGRPAADVDDQTLVGTQRAGMHHARINQPRFLETGDDFNGMPQRGARPLQKPSLAPRAA